MYDVIVLGLGAMGSATLRELAVRGQRVLGIDRFHPPHDQGSTHGESRIIREAYWEKPSYVPLVQEAFRRWEHLETELERTLMRTTGALMVGPADGAVFRGSLASARQHNLDVEVLDADQLDRRFPYFRSSVADPPVSALFEKRAAVLQPERVVEALLRDSEARGASLLLGRAVLAVDLAGEQPKVVLEGGEVATAERLVICAGSWLRELVPEIAIHLQVERQVMHWFHVRGPHAESLRRSPVWIWEHTDDVHWYGFPATGDGLMKVGLHHGGLSVTPDDVDRVPGPEDIAAIRETLDRFLPDAIGEWERGRVCLYTNTPDHHFLIDQHPQAAHTYLVSACSGHGFKFASALGVIAADWAAGKDHGFDLSDFTLARFDSQSDKPA